MDTFPFHWDTLDAPQCLVMACLCPDECHEHLALPQVTLFHILIGNWFRSVSFPPMSITAPPPELISILIHIDFSAWEVSSYTVALLLIQNVRASEELPKISFPGTEYCCPTLSNEGVCNCNCRVDLCNGRVVLPSHMRVSATARQLGSHD